MSRERFMKIYDVIIPNEKGCKVWPYPVWECGYPYFWHEGGYKRGNRVALECKLGRTIKPKLQALHTCDIKACVSFDHLYEGTQLKNMQDRMARGHYQFGDDHPARKHPECWARGDKHYTRTNPELVPRGEKHAQSKLSNVEVRAIRRSYAKGRITQKQLAVKYGVAQGIISGILTGDSWQHVPWESGQQELIRKISLKNNPNGYRKFVT